MGVFKLGYATGPEFLEYVMCVWERLFDAVVFLVHKMVLEKAAGLTVFFPFRLSSERSQTQNNKLNQVDFYIFIILYVLAPASTREGRWWWASVC